MSISAHNERIKAQLDNLLYLCVHEMPASCESCQHSACCQWDRDASWCPLRMAREIAIEIERNRA